MTTKLTQKQFKSIFSVTDWPAKLADQPEEIEFCMSITRKIEPFLHHLLSRGLTYTTLRRHSRNLFILTHSLVRSASIQSENTLIKIDIDEMLQQTLNDKEGPLLHSATEYEQREFDSTCGIFFRYLKTQKPEII